MRKLIATTALALIIGGPAVAQDQPPADQVQQDQVAQEQQQPPAMGQGFYQPQQTDLFISALMDAQVYAPPSRAVQMQDQPVQQEAVAEPAPAEQEQPPAEAEPAPGEQPADQEMEVEVEVDPQTEQADAEVVDEQPAEPAPEMQQMQDQQMQQQVGQTRTVTQEELDQMENIGQVTDIIIDEQGEVRAIVVEVGGFLGIGAREVALSMDEVEFARDQDNPDQFHVITHVGADELEQAPEFERAAVEQQQETAVAPEQEAAPGEQQQQAWREGRQVMPAPQIEREGYMQAEPGTYSADDLIGANVYDVNDDNIGSVSDVVLGADGQAEFAVIDVGGFLGIGTHTVALGFDELQVLHDEGWADLRVYVDVTQEQLEQMPEYEQN